MYKLLLKLDWKVISSSLYAAMFIASVCVIFAYFNRPTSSIATVNVTGLVSSFVKETSKQNLTMEQKQKKIDQFGQSMQHVLDDIAKRNHVIIMMSEAVIAGAPDLTQVVMTSIKKEIKS